MNTIGLRHQCLCEVIEALDIASAALSRAKQHLSMDFISDARQLHGLKVMLSGHRRIIAEKSLELRSEIDGRKP